MVWVSEKTRKLCDPEGLEHTWNRRVYGKRAKRADDEKTRNGPGPGGRKRLETGLETVGNGWEWLETSGNGGKRRETAGDG